ncbi:GTPase [Massilia violaceinigra]|uniref:GTPase n=1 Tax=Massilia violaceinigra TaxID=2045208 RepID=A0ABY4AKB1_9BURK|nr:GTPase [Massilia violaceinigra]UOD33053.1 GTPase [Massilia violaceinigra]
MSAPPARRTALTLVTGGSAAQREAAIAARLAQVAAVAGPTHGVSAVLLEGLPSGQTVLSPSDSLPVHRIAPGCLCCTGNLVLRVTLNRILRLRPDRLFIGLAATDHLDQLRSWLQDPPYDQLLELTADLRT